MRTQRQLKVGEEIRHALAMLFQRGDVPWPREFTPPIVTISEVQISPDLSNASAFFTVMGEGADAHVTRKILNTIGGFFRHEIAKTVRLRLTPKIDFKVDTSFSYATNIDRLLNAPEVAKDLKSDQVPYDIITDAE
ncbi:MAG: 30S ribosome-binding factor RbfA [Alphaproteobacteria bacterium]|nr:30S ribosome-binding factor RbfA [Alphaproteobacteria bacterium]